MESGESSHPEDLPDFLKDPNKTVTPPAGDEDRARYSSRINEIASLPDPKPQDLAELSMSMMSIMGGKEEKHPEGIFVRKSDFAGDPSHTGFLAQYNEMGGASEKQIQQLSIFFDKASKLVKIDFDEGKYNSIGIADTDDMIFSKQGTTRPLKEGEVKQYIDKLAQKFNKT